MANLSEVDFDECVNLALKTLKGTNISDLKSEQREALLSLVKGEDVFGVLPTGYGKSLIYQIVPKLFPLLAQRNIKVPTHRQHATVLVVSPLISLMRDQVKEMTILGLDALYLSSEHTLTRQERDKIKNGSTDIILASPESWLGAYRDLFASESFRKNVVLVVADEAHVIPKWGSNQKTRKAFRTAFSQLGELRALLRKDVPFLALTATANKSTRNKIAKTLVMKKPHWIIRSPQRGNIYLECKKVGDFECLNWLIEMLAEKQKLMERTLVYCKSLKDCSEIYSRFLNVLGDNAYVKRSSTLSTDRLFALYHHNTYRDKKDLILKDLMSDDGQFRVIICTNALGMGINVPNIRQVIHFGLPKNTEAYIQEVGRAGRDSGKAVAVMYYQARHLLGCEDSIKSYARNSTKCRKTLLYADFGAEENECNHTCCDICKTLCECALPECKLVISHKHVDSNTISHSETPAVRDPTDEDIESVRVCLHELQEKCADLNTLGVNFLPDSLIIKITEQCTYIDSFDYIVENLNVIHPVIAIEILTIINEVFDDNIDCPTQHELMDYVDDIDDYSLLLAASSAYEQNVEHVDILEEHDDDL